MASQFIGLQMLVTLRSPPARLKGIVSAVEAGAGLTLSNVWWLDVNRWEPRVTIQADNIVEVSEIPSQPPANPYLNPTRATEDALSAAAAAAAQAQAQLSQQVTASKAVPKARHAHAPAPAAVPVPAPKAATPVSSATSLVDPAILSVGKRPGSRTVKPSVDTQLPTVLANKSRQGAGRSQNVSPTVVVVPILEAHAQQPLRIHEPDGLIRQAREAPLPLPLPAHEATEDSGVEAAEAAQAIQNGQVAAHKKSRSRRSRQGSTRNGQLDDAEASTRPAGGAKPPSATVPAAAAAGRGKGWRQTPILRNDSSSQPTNSARKVQTQRAIDNGWASEDVTDIQEMGDFDFDAGLTKFDKQNLFEQMRKDDQTDDADRLVTHNRQPKPKPGTSGGKNLHYSENVLDMPTTMSKAAARDDFWNSEADDGVLNGGADRDSGREPASRQGSRRGESKVSANRRSQSRKASTTAGPGNSTAPGTGITGQGPNKVNSGVSATIRPRRSRGGRRHRERRLAKEVDMQKQQQQQQQQLATNPSAVPVTTTVPQDGLCLLPSNRRIEPVSPLQMLNLENIAAHDVGLTEDMMTENAGRGIAEVTLIALSDPAIRVRHAGTADPKSGVVPPPTVVILAGNNKSGTRAIAAGRHLRNKGIIVLACVVGQDRGERDLLEDMRQQIHLYKNLGGRIFTKTDLFEHIRKLSVPTLTIDTPRSSSLASLANPAPVTLIIDALLGLAVSFEELRTSDQATTYELIEWANRNEAFALAIDVPTGIDPSSGKVSVVDGSKLYVKPRYVVSVAAPKRGLCEVLATAAAALARDGRDGDEEATTVMAADATMPDDAALEWKLYLADMGLGSAVWKKLGTRIRRGIDFDDKWVLEMRYRGAGYDAVDAV